jgi:hypothetical protein
MAPWEHVHGAVVAIAPVAFFAFCYLMTFIMAPKKKR